jgi:integrase
VTAKGARAFVGVYQFDGAERRDVIGAYPVWGANAARERFKQWKRDAELGVDPRGDPEPEDPTASSFRARAEQYLADPRKKRQKTPLRPATQREYRRSLLGYAVALHNKSFDSISRREVADLLDTVKMQRGVVSAMRTRAAIGRLYSWGIARGYVEHSPVTGTEGWETPKRARELSDAELRMVWAGTREPTAFHMIVRLLLWTGARPAEAGGLCKSELRPEGTWELPAERSKNGRALVLPLSRQARAAIAAYQARHPWRELILGRSGDRPFSGWSAAKRKLDGQMARANAERRQGRSLKTREEPAELDFMRPWQLRDVRRTVETRLASMGVAQELINRILNHAQGPITTTYNRYEYLQEKQQALQSWADELERISPPVTANVVSMTSRP